jgi:hypothetical protein
LLIYAALLRLVSVVHPVPVSENNWSNPLARLVYNSLHAMPFWNNVWDFALSVLVCVSLALYLNAVFNRYRLNYAGGYIPAFAFVLAASFTNEFTVFSAPLLALLPLIGAFSTMIASYKEERAAGNWFDAGFLVSTAALIYFPFIGFVLFMLIAYLVIRPFNMRELMVAFVGVAVPLFFALVIYYWNGKANLLVNHISHYYAPENVIRAKEYLLPLAIRLGALLLMLMGAAFAVRKVYNKAVMQHRIVISLCFAFIAAGAVTTLMMPDSYFAHFVWIAVPFGALVGLVLPEMKREWTPEVLHFCLILLLFFFQYFYPASVN